MPRQAQARRHLQGDRKRSKLTRELLIDLVFGRRSKDGTPATCTRFPGRGAD